MAVVTTAGAAVLLGGSSLLGIGSSNNYSSIKSPTGASQLITGKAFVDMVRETPYKDVLAVNTTYEVYIIKKAQLHRLLLVKMKHSSYSWITFEVNTPNMTDLTTVMQETESLPWNSERVDTYKGTLLNICKIADGVVERMEHYRLFSSNCQHFCNNLLLELGLDTYATTVGPQTTLEPMSHHYTARGLDCACSTAMEFAPGTFVKAAATVVGFAIGAPSTVAAARK